MTTTYLISGASRGLGLETARQLLAASTSNRVIAAARSPKDAAGLQELITANPGRIEAVTLDVANGDSIKSGIAEVSKLELAKDGIDVLINNAGISASMANPTGVIRNDLQAALDVNVFGAIELTVAALPLLRAGKSKKIITTSSRMGSIATANFSLFATGYCVSKTAVNMYFVKLANELKPEGFTVILHCPGYVKTDFTGGLDGPAPLFKEDSVAGSIKNVFSRGIEDTGKFIEYTGEEIPW